MRRIAPLALVASAVVAYALANVVHEGLGHGGACLAVGGKAVRLNAVFFECDEAGLSAAAARAVSAGGTIVNLLLGVAALAALRRATRPAARYFAWLFMTVNLLQGTGYWLFSGLGGIGDWAVVVAGGSPLWRVVLAVAGGAGYWLTIRLSLATLAPMLGAGPERLALGQRLTLVPYLVGGMLYVAAGFLNPFGMKLVLMSAAAASFGGTSALAWMTQLMRDERRYPPGGDALALAPSIAWTAAGAAVAVLFVVVLGRGIAF